jgi:hypothetical protein
MAVNEILRKTDFCNIHSILIFGIIFGGSASYFFRKWCVGVWAGSSWLRIGRGGGHL